MFSVLEGEIDVVFRGITSVVRSGETINIPANAPPCFSNSSSQPARLLCLCSPAGQEEYFMEIGDPVADRTSTPPSLSEADIQERKTRAELLAAKYRTEILKP
jgi:uncharacterized cupin superfamily protein